MKKALLILFAGILVFTFIHGCGEEKQSEDQTTPDVTTEEPVDTTEAAPMEGDTTDVIDASDEGEPQEETTEGN